LSNKACVDVLIFFVIIKQL